MRADKKTPLKSDKKAAARSHKRGVVGYSKKTALLEDAITQMNAGKYGRSSAALKELLALDPHNMEARRLFATLHLRLGSLIPARQAFDSLINEALERQDYWLAESLLREYLAAGPRCVPFLEKLGIVYQEKGDSLEAASEYGKAIDILIEDPDPDNPHHASQLYAKIRELAPASPVAFRLASFFDAQTGELVAPPRSHSGGAAATTSLSPAADDAPAALSIPEPAAGLMPWEQAEDSSSEQGSSPVQASVPPSDSPVSSDSTDALLQEERLHSDTPQVSSSGPAIIERSDPGLETQAELRVETPETNPINEPVEESTAKAAPDLSPDVLQEDAASFVPTPEVPYAAATDSMEEAPETPREPDSTRDSKHDLVSSPPPFLPEHGRPSQVQHETVGETVSAPMPWEDVHEATISIPDHVPDVPPVPEGLLTAPLPEPESAAIGQDESRDAPSPTSGVTKTGGEVRVAEEPSGAASGPVPDQAPADPLQESSKGGGFSWESVFNSAWKFGDKLSTNVPHPETVQADTIQIEEPAAATTSSLHGQMPETESVEIPEAVQDQSPADASAVASVTAPMPWDQVQESIITIPPAQVDEPVAESPAEPSVQSTSPVDPLLTQHRASASVETRPEVSDSPVNAAAAQSLSGPEFRLVGSMPVHSATEARSSGVEAESSSTTGARVSEPQKPVEPELSAFTLAASVPPAEVAPAPPTYIEPAVQLREEAIEPVETAPPSISASLSAPVVETARTETPSENKFPSFKEKHVEPASAWTPESVAVARPARPAEPAVPLAPPEVQVSIPPEPPPESAQTPSQSTGDPSHWNTGEVAVQAHRPPSKKRKRTPEPVPEPPVASLLSEETDSRQAEQNERQEAAFAEARARIPDSVPQQEAWVKTGESIRFIEESKTPPVAEPVPQAPAEPETGMMQPVSTAAAAVDVLFESSGHAVRTGTRERAAEPKPRYKLHKVRSKLNRIRIGMSVFIGSCFSTTRAIVTSLVALAVLAGALVVLAIGAVGLTWVIMEEPPSPVFQSLTTSPQRTLSDSKKNGYLLLLGFDAPAEQDPIQTGYERKPDAKDADRAMACLGGPDGGAPVGQSNASANVASGWFRASDPVGQFKSHQDTIRGWVGRGESALDRYRQWQKLSFEDWGYGQTVSPPCASIVFAHQLHLADGFVQGTDTGVDRLETDMEAWRIALGQAKTLPIKTLALQAINDDIAVASGLLVRPDFDGKHLSRIAKMLRPLDQVELSIRWPMQSELVSATKTYEAQLKAERAEEQALHAVVASALPLPKQRRFNDYAEYYEASYKAAGEGRYGSLPKWNNYIRFPADTVLDYLTNPIENIVGLEPLAPWDLYNGLVVDTDAHLRLASLQAWLRRGPQDADLLARIAKAGQNFYDPYTGLPMLVNLKKGVMYSVGHDGKDQDADPHSDVVVKIPINQAPAAPAKSPSGSSRSK